MKQYLLLLSTITLSGSCLCSEYSINLMWINSHKNNSSYIYSSNNLSTVQQKVLDAVLNWALVNPQSTVNLWFDSAMTNADAIKRTHIIIDEQRHKHANIAQIQLKDVRDLQIVKKHAKVFSKKTPVYFRADLLRAIVGMHVATKDNHTFVYADLDVKPLNKEQIFDDITMLHLKEYGIVLNFNEQNLFNFENQFQIITAENPQMIKAMKHALIKLNIERAYYALEKKFDYRSYGYATPTENLKQIVYNSYPTMFQYWHHLKKSGTLMVVPNQQDIIASMKQSIILDDHDYDATTDRFEPFGMIDPQYKKLFFKKIGEPLKIPTKNVPVPPPSFVY